MNARPTLYQQFPTWLQGALDQKIQAHLPNVEEITDPAEALRVIQRTKEMHVPYQFMLPIPHEHGPSRRVWYPKIFTNSRGMGSRFDGSGIILAEGKAYSFHMCKHEWDESGANHSRGWHPKICTKCGFDASIDSGD